MGCQGDSLVLNDYQRHERTKELD